MAVKNHTLSSNHVDQDESPTNYVDQDESPAQAKWPEARLRPTTTTSIERTNDARPSVRVTFASVFTSRIARSIELGGRGPIIRPSPDRVSDLLRGRIGVRDCATLHEMVDRGGRLIGGQNPRRTLRFDRPSEVRAEERTNELAADAEFVRDRLRAICALRIDFHGFTSPRCVRLHDPIKAQIVRSMCVRSIVLHTHYIRSRRASTFVRSLCKIDVKSIPPPSAYAKEELTFFARARKSEAGWLYELVLLLTTWEAYMPARSNKQRRWAFAVKGPAWAKRHHFDKVRKSRKKRKGK